MHAEKPSLGTELRRLREIRRLSLREVEDATGISNPYLSQLENDRIKKPSPHFLYKLSNLYGVDYQLIMERAGYAGPRKEAAGPKTLAGAALFATEHLTEQEEEKLMEYLQFLRRKQK